MKILFLLRALNLGGAQRQLIALAGGLRRRGHRIVVATFYNDSHYEKKLQDCGVPLYALEKSGRWAIGSFLWKLVRLVKTEEPDILHSYLPVPNAASVLLKPFFPKLRIVCGVRCASDHGEWRRDRLAWRMDKAASWLARHADLTITNSLAGAAYAKNRGVAEERMIVIPNGIDVEEFYPDREGGNRLRRAWGVTAEEILVGIVGRLNPVKDHKTFIEAASLLLERNPSFRFVVVGDGTPDYQIELKKLAQEKKAGDHVIWAGIRSDMRSVYSSFDVLCSTSCSEGFSNVIGEAMACGVPCAVTDVGDSARIVGALGVIAPPGSASRMSAGINELLERVRYDACLGKKCRRRIEEEFSLDKMITTTEQALNHAGQRA